MIIISNDFSLDKLSEWSCCVLNDAHRSLVLAVPTGLGDTVGSGDGHVVFFLFHVVSHSGPVEQAT